MSSIGETLRNERLRQGLELQAVAESTKINKRMLQAIEAEDFSKLPGGVFTRNFVRQYAVALKLDPAPLESELKRLYPDPEETDPVYTKAEEAQLGKITYSFSSGKDRSILVSAGWVLLALAGCGGAYYLLNRTPGAAMNAQNVAVQQQQPVSNSTPVIPAPTSSKPTAPAEAEPQVQAAKESPSSASGSLQVVLSASEPSWISVKADGKSAFVGTLQPNEKREVSADSSVKIVAGNAGGLEISINGKPINAIGPKGQVRTVELTPTGVYVVPRTPPNPAPLL